MSIFPHYKLFLGPSQTIVISGPHIQSVDTLTGQIVQSTTSLPSHEKDAVTKSGPIRCAALDSSNAYLATAGDDKKLKLWEVDGLKLLSERELPKKPTEIRFTRDSNIILVSDKFGDVFSYPLHYLPPTADTGKSKLSSHENPSGGTLVLGHASHLTSFLLSYDERYIITADRDEHIRVSWFPQGFNIEMYCLGHTKFVSAIHMPTFDPSTLVSGGGDSMMKVWNWMSGKVKCEIEVWDKVEPFVKVRGKKYRWGEYEGDDDGKKTGKGKRKRKGKSKKLLEGEDEETRDQSEPVDVDLGDGKDARPMANILLVIHKIGTLDSRAGNGRYIVFSAVGATALFICPYPSMDVQSSKSRIQHFDFERPVVDFVSDDEGHIWVLLDAEWDDPENAKSPSRKDTVRVVRLVEGELREVDDTPRMPLLESLNTHCLVQATSADIKTLDIYSPLSAMPKNHEVEFNAMERGLSEEGDDVLTGADAPKEKKLSRKELGRLKSKKALLKKDTGDDDEEVRTAKKSKADSKAG